MNWTIRVHKTPALVRVRLRGRFKLEEFRQMVGRLTDAIDDLEFRPILFDEREFDLSRVNVPDMMAVRAMLESNMLNFAFRKMAILVSSAPEFAIATSFKRISLPVRGALIDVFQNECEALGWLTNPQRC